MAIATSYATVAVRVNSDVFTVMGNDGVYELSDRAIHVQIFFGGECYHEYIENTLQAWLLLKLISETDTSTDEFLELMCQLDDMWD